ncbi:MAG: transposase [Acidobacteria bacterium]|nr:transposase [Acidobacteriota bacterium]
MQTATENRRVCAAFLRGLVERGLRAEEGLLVVTDGVKRLHAAVAEVFRAAAVLPCCQWHKRENVVSYLPETHRAAIRRKLQAACEHPTHDGALKAVKAVRQELRLLNATAAASLDEGLEETLTLHRLGVFAELGISLKTTNLLESIHARVEARVQRVDHWRNSDQKQRWLATAPTGPRATTASHQALRSIAPAATGLATRLATTSRRGRSQPRKPRRPSPNLNYECIDSRAAPQLPAPTRSQHRGWRRQLRSAIDAVTACSCSSARCS